MKTRQLYFDDPLCLEFMADVTEIITREKGKVSVLMPQTYFYPTSGGQDHDTGKIGEAIVLDVYKTEDGRIIHILDREVISASVKKRPVAGIELRVYWKSGEVPWTWVLQFLSWKTT